MKTVARDIARMEQVVRFALPAAAAGLMIVLGIALLFFLAGSREQALDTGRRLTDSVAAVVAEQTGRTLESIEQTLETAEGYVTQSYGGPLTVDQRLQALIANRLYLADLRIVDAEGTIIYSSNDTNGRSLADQTYFKKHKALADGSVQLEKPYRSGPGAREWLIPVVHSFTTPDGRFAGLVVAALDPFYFARVWAVGGGVTDLSVGLFDTDGTLMMRTPIADAQMGRVIPNPRLVEAFGREHTGFVEGVGAIAGGGIRLISFHRIAEHGDLVVAVGLPRTAVLGPWENYASLGVACWIGATAVIAALIFWLRRQWLTQLATENRYLALFNANPYPVFLLDTERGRFLAVNQAAIDNYGWSRREFLGMPFSAILTEAELAEFGRMLAHPEFGRPGHIFTTSHPTRSGKRLTVELTTRELDVNGRRAVMIIARDITERRRAERARLKMEDRIRQYQKTDALGQMTGGIAHDFNNLLSVITIRMETLQEDLPANSPFRQTVDLTLAAAQRGAKLVARLLAFSRRRALKPERSDVSGIVEGFMPLLTTAVPQVRVEAECEAGLRPCLLDRTGFETALLNLVVNARDAMKAGDTIRIVARNEEILVGDLPVHFDATPGHWVKVSVVDTGAGIPAELLDDVLEPFFTTKKEGKGTGLGLSMVATFASESGGFVTLDSIVGEGTTFSIYLPALDAGAASCAPTASQAA